MANKFHIYVGGDYDVTTHTPHGGMLSATFTSEREAFLHEKKLQWEHRPGIPYMVCEGDERFAIVPVVMDGKLWYDIVDKQTHTMGYGLCRTMKEAVEYKAHAEKFHWTGGKWMDEYYKQFQAA